MEGDFRKNTRRVILAALALAVMWLAAFLLRPFYRGIFYAVILAVAFYPVYLRLLRWLKRSAWASLLAVLLIIVLVVVPLAFIGVTAAGEARSGYSELAKRSAEAGGWGVYFSQLVDRPVAWVASKTGSEPPNIRSAMISQLGDWSANLAHWAGSLAGNLTGTLGDALVALFTLFFLFQQMRGIRDGLYRWLPLERERIDSLLKTVSDAIVANVYGIAAVGLAQGLLTTIGFLITGLPSPMLWGVVAAFASLIPLVGTTLVWAPAAVYLFIVGSWGKGLILVAWGALVISMADNIIRPLVLAGKSNMNTIVVFFALMGGMHAFGFLGIFAGPVIFSVALPLVRTLAEEFGLEPTD